MPVPNGPFTTLNFVDVGIIASDAGAAVADITSNPPYVDLRFPPYNVVANDSTPAVAAANTTAINQAIVDFSGTSACLALPQGNIFVDQAAGSANWSIRFGPGTSFLTLRGQGMFGTLIVQNGAGDLGAWDAIVVDGAENIELCDFGVMQGTIDNPDPGQQNHLIAIYNLTGVASKNINCHDLYFGKCIGDGFRVFSDADGDVVEEIKLLNFIMMLDGVVNIPSGRVGARCGIAVQRGYRNVEIGEFFIFGVQNSPIDCEPTGAGICEGFYVHDGIADNSIGNTGTCASYGGGSGGATAFDMVVRDVKHLAGKIVVMSTDNALFENVSVFTDVVMPADPTEALFQVRQSNPNIILRNLNIQRIGTSGSGNGLDVENSAPGTRIFDGYFELTVAGDPITFDGCSNLTVIGPEINYNGPIPDGRNGIIVNAVLNNADDIFIDDVKVSTVTALRLQAGVLLQVRAPRSMQRLHVSNVKCIGNGAHNVVLYSIGAGTTFEVNPIFFGLGNTGSGPPNVWRAENAGGVEVNTVFPITAGSRGLLSARRLEGLAAPNGAVVGNLGDIYTWRPSTTTAEVWKKSHEAVAGIPDNVGWTLLVSEFVPVATARALDVTFTPNAIKYVMGIYTVEIEAAAGDDGSIELRSDAAALPVTVRVSGRNAITAGGDTIIRQQLSYIVPPSHNVQLVTVVGAGTPVFTLVDQTEITFE